MRIAMLSWETLHSPVVGGVGRHVSELAAALVAAGHDVHVFTRTGHAQTYHEMIDGVHYHRCPYLMLPDFVDDVNSMCRAFVERVFVVEDMTGPFDVVHAHDWLAANAMIWIQQGRGRPGVFTVHSTEYARCGNTFPPGRSERIRVQERAGTYWAARIICVSAAVRAEIAWMYEVPLDKTRVIHNGVNATRFHEPADTAAVRRRHGMGPRDPLLVFSGRMEWQKGPDLLLEAMPDVLRAHPETKLVYVGDGSMRAGMERRAFEIGAGHAVRFLGRRDETEIAALYQAAQVVCVPSRNEPFGIVILEAWSAGKPVVVTDRGGACEVVRHLYSGVHVSPAPDSIAWGVNTLLADPDRAHWMGANGRHESSTRFAWPLIAQHTLDVYGEVAIQHGVPAFEADRAPQPTIALAKEVAGTVVTRAAKNAAKRRGGEPAEQAPDDDRTPATPRARHVTTPV